MISETPYSQLEKQLLENIPLNRLKCNVFLIDFARTLKYIFRQLFGSRSSLKEVARGSFASRFSLSPNQPGNHLEM